MGSEKGVGQSSKKTVLGDLEKSMPQEVRKWINWEQTTNEQGPWPTRTMLSLWFIHDTGLMMMIEIMQLMRDELDGAEFCENGEREGTNLEKSQKKPQARAQALIFKGLKENR